MHMDSDGDPKVGKKSLFANTIFKKRSSVDMSSSLFGTKNKLKLSSQSLPSVTDPIQPAKGKEEKHQRIKLSESVESLALPPRKKRNRTNSMNMFKSKPSELYSLHRKESLQKIPADQEIELFSIIGRGRTGTVYRCSVEGWICAMKEITKDGVNDNSNSEIVMIQKMPNHSNVMNYFGYKQTPTSVQIFQELFHANLSDMIKEQKEVFPTKEIAECLVQVAYGLEALHRCHVLHRDVKSRNILVKRTMDDGRTYVLGDPGCVELITNQITSTINGNPYVMAPEVFSDGVYSYPADVYAFGLLIFELITQTVPFAQPSLAVDKIINGVLPEIPSDISADTMPLILLYESCISKTPSNRPTASQVAGKLRAILFTLQH